MGQKINPIAFRLGVNRGWYSIWFAKKKEFGTYLIEDFKIRKYIEKIKNNVLKISKDSEVTVNIKEIKKPELNSYLVAENIATQLVKRIAYRRAMKRAMQSAIRLGALGIKVMISGRLAGNEIARTEWEREGSIPSHTLRANIDYGTAEALTTYGIIGIKVWIYKGQLFEKDVEQEKKERVKNATASKN